MLDRIETSTIPAPMTFAGAPRPFAIHAKYAMTGDRKANAVQPRINDQLYTPCVSMAVA